MDENIANEVVEEVNSEVNEFDGWDDESTADEQETESTQTEAPITETSTETETTPTDEGVSENAEPTEEAPQIETYQFLETKYNHEPKTYDLSNAEQKDEVVRLVQKGQNYDKVKSELERLKGESAELKFLKDSLASIKGEFEDGYALLDDALASKLVESEANNGRVVTREEALRRVKANRESIFSATKENTENIKQKSIEQFASLYPNVKPESIPKAVWDEFTETSDLVTAYSNFERNEKQTAFATLQKDYESLKAELETMKQNEKNRERSTGSQRTAGSPPPKDPDFDGWED